jgi:gas vesicle protein
LPRRREPRRRIIAHTTVAIDETIHRMLKEICYNYYKMSLKTCLAYIVASIYSQIQSQIAQEQEEKLRETIEEAREEVREKMREAIELGERLLAMKQLIQAYEKKLELVKKRSLSRLRDISRGISP